jgi:hypothetical protein
VLYARPSAASAPAEKPLRERLDVRNWSLRASVMAQSDCFRARLGHGAWPISTHAHLAQAYIGPTYRMYPRPHFGQLR